jgi:hypothetical protein
MKLWDTVGLVVEPLGYGRASPLTTAVVVRFDWLRSLGYPAG